jgi:hypothetical protein
MTTPIEHIAQVAQDRLEQILHVGGHQMER